MLNYVFNYMKNDVNKMKILTKFQETINSKRRVIIRV